MGTKWPGISYVDAAFEVPHSNVVYLFEGDFQRVFLHLNIDCSQFNGYSEAVLITA